MLNIPCCIKWIVHCICIAQSGRTWIAVLWMTCILVWFIIVSIYHDLILDEKSPEMEKKRIEWVTGVWQILQNLARRFWQDPKALVYLGHRKSPNRLGQGQEWNDLWMVITSKALSGVICIWKIRWYYVLKRGWMNFDEYDLKPEFRKRLSLAL